MNKVYFDGEFYQAVDIGKEGGRHAVVLKGKGTVLLTAMHSPMDEREAAISAAMAMDAAEKAKRAPGLVGRLKGFFG